MDIVLHSTRYSLQEVLGILNWMSLRRIVSRTHGFYEGNVEVRDGRMSIPTNTAVSAKYLLLSKMFIGILNVLTS